MKAERSLLLVDDDPNILEVLDARFSAAGFRLFKATSGQAALEIIQNTDIDLIVSDIKMPQMSGLELFNELQTAKPDIPVIFLTAHGTIPEAVEAVLSGAIDYLTKPFDGKELVKKVQNFLSSPPINGKKINKKVPSSNFIWGTSEEMQHLREMVHKVAETNVNSLILGESGVGKECIAKAIHQNSPRRNGPYIIVDCGSTPPGILESELFGHTKGALPMQYRIKKA